MNKESCGKKLVLKSGRAITGVGKTLEKNCYGSRV
jgi:hypothetical protein